MEERVKKIKVTTYIPQSIKEQIDELAQEKRRTFASIFEEACEDIIEKHKKERS